MKTTTTTTTRREAAPAHDLVPDPVPARAQHRAAPRQRHLADHRTSTRSRQSCWASRLDVRVPAQHRLDTAITRTSARRTSVQRLLLMLLLLLLQSPKQTPRRLRQGKPRQRSLRSGNRPTQRIVAAGRTQCYDESPSRGIAFIYIASRSGAGENGAKMMHYFKV